MRAVAIRQVEVVGEIVDRDAVEIGALYEKSRASYVGGIIESGVMFLHRCSEPDARDIEAGCPPTCPTGLFGGPLDYLTGHENHRHEHWGRHGMVYWARDTLLYFASLDEIPARAA